MGMIKHILVPTDCSEVAHHAAVYANNLAKELDASLTLLMVADDRSLDFLGPAYLPEDIMLAMEHNLRNRADHLLEEFIKQLGLDEEEVQTCVKLGEPYDEIIDYSENHGVDLIVMGTHGRSGVSHLVLGSLTEQVSRHSPCPVLSVRNI